MELRRKQKKEVQVGDYCKINNQFRKDSEGNDFDTSLDDRIMDTPDLMTNSALLESVNKIKKLINKI